MIRPLESVFNILTSAMFSFPIRLFEKIIIPFVTNVNYGKSSSDTLWTEEYQDGNQKSEGYFNLGKRILHKYFGSSQKNTLDDRECLVANASVAASFRLR